VSAQLSLATKTAYGFGQVAEGVKNGAFGIFLFFFFNQVLGLSGSLAGLALLIALVFDAVTDPLAGSISDSFRHRWGRRHPFMYVSAVPMAVSFALLFNPPAGLGQTGLFLWLTGFTVLVRGSMTLYSVPHLALGAELSQDYHERTTVVAFRTVFGLTGVILVVALAWSLFFESTPEFGNGQLNPAAYPGFGAFFGAIILTSILGSALGTHSRIPHLPPPPAHPEPFSVGRLRRELVGALANRSFRALFIGVVIFFVTRGVQDTLGLHMATYFWALPPKQIQGMQLAGALGFLPGVPFWTFVARRFDKKPTFLLAISIFSVLTLTPPLAYLAGFFPPQESAAYFGLLVGVACCAAFAAAGGLVTSGSMMADIADEHELITGHRQEGIFFGALTLAVKSASGLGHGIAGFAVDAIGFPRQAVPGQVATEVLTSLGVLYGPGIALLAVVAVAFMTGYALTDAKHAAIVARLSEMRARAAG